MTDMSTAGGTTILHLTDTHLHAAADSRMRGVTTYETFLEVLQHAQSERCWPPDAILVTGDIVQDESRAGYQRFRDSLEPLGIPVYCVPGNHDDPKLMDELLNSGSFKVGGSVRIGAWAMILLNTFLTGEDAGGLGQARLNGLEGSLRDHAGEHVLVCMHHQPMAMGSAWLDGVGLRDASRFLAVIDAHDNVRGIVWGHVHQASDRMRGAVRFLSTPSTCSQFLPNSEFFALDERPPGLRWIQLFDNGEIQTRIDWLPGHS